MKLVVCSDAHLDWVTAGVSRFEEIERALRAAAHHAVRVRADAFVFAGDLCDPDSGPVVLRCADVIVSIAHWLFANDVRSIWVAGNHDVVHDGNGTTSLTPLRAIAEVHEVPTIARDPAWSHAIVTLPHVTGTTPVDYGEQVRNAIAHVGDQPVVIVSHLTVPGIDPGEETSEMPRGAERLLPISVIEEHPQVACVLQGHYHASGRYFLKDGRAHKGVPGACIPLYVVGSLARLTFGGEEEIDPSFFELEV